MLSVQLAHGIEFLEHEPSSCRVTGFGCQPGPSLMLPSLMRPSQRGCSKFHESYLVPYLVPLTVHQCTCSGRGAQHYYETSVIKASGSVRCRERVTPMSPRGTQLETPAKVGAPCLLWWPWGSFSWKPGSMSKMLP